MENNIEMLGLISALKKQMDAKEKEGKTEVKDKKISKDIKTGTIKTSEVHKTEVIYTKENQKKIDNIKKKASEAIAKIPFTEVPKVTLQTKITSSASIDSSVEKLIEALLNTDKDLVELLDRITAMILN